MKAWVIIVYFTTASGQQYQDVVPLVRSIETKQQCQAVMMPVLAAWAADQGEISIKRFFCQVNDGQRPA